jgi:hypothetical protein
VFALSFFDLRDRLVEAFVEPSDWVEYYPIHRWSMPLSTGIVIIDSNASLDNPSIQNDIEHTAEQLAGC